MSKLEPARTYSNPTATEVLRRLLDERGVKYDKGATVISGIVATFWHDRDGYPCSAIEGADDIPDGEVSFQACVTPEQAIAATLGAGTCKRVMDSIDPFTMWVCDHCGHPLDTSENFCGGCGRKVVEPTKNDVDVEVEQ